MARGNSVPRTLAVLAATLTAALAGGVLAGCGVATPDPPGPVLVTLAPTPTTTSSGTTTSTPPPTATPATSSTQAAPATRSAAPRTASTAKTTNTSDDDGLAIWCGVFWLPHGGDDDNGNGDNGNGDNGNWNGCAHGPLTDIGAPAGAVARCEDGTYSFSRIRKAVCAGHGGVAEWE
ncbi:MAG TPA: DUF3761 domain-containing protein [Pseudonocardiaceae bacterium]